MSTILVRNKDSEAFFSFYIPFKLLLFEYFIYVYEKVIQFVNLKGCTDIFHQFTPFSSSSVLYY